MKTLLPLLLSLSLTVAGCTLPLFQFSEGLPDLNRYRSLSSHCQNDYFRIDRLPQFYDCHSILEQATNVVQSLSRQLKIRPPKKPVTVIVFSVDEKIGRTFLRMSGSHHRSTGFYQVAERLLLVTGCEEDERFWAVLRHEAAHSCLHNTIGADVKIPFWLSEGIASFFEQEIADSGEPGINTERQRLLAYLIGRGKKLYFEDLLERPFPKHPNGETYARAWGLIYCLFSEKRSIARFFGKFTQQPSLGEDLFQKYLLNNNETPQDFETTCSRRLLQLSRSSH